jgi:hypothetical protein
MEQEHNSAISLSSLTLIADWVLSNFQPTTDVPEKYDSWLSISPNCPQEKLTIYEKGA